MRLLKKASMIINQPSRFENEPKHLLVLLRLLYLGEILYELMCFFLMLSADGIPYIVGLFFFGAAVCGFALTYWLPRRANVLLYAVFQIAWVVLFVWLFGWDCGVQHFIFSLLVLSYFVVYDALPLKAVFTVCLFCLRFGMFCYCRVCVPVVELPGFLIVELQILNSAMLFLRLAFICGSFSSNIETAEQKLVLYNEQLKQQASTDPLTGIWNRRSMIKYMEEHQAADPAARFAIALGDIDHFKMINDRWGHDCGDAVLVWLTELFQDSIGGRGVVCRWGGEEFLFHFNDMNGDEAYQVISDLRYRLNDTPFLWKGEEIKVTITVGIEENDFRSELTKLISRVDEKLYQGKDSGRNTIVY